MKKSTQTLLLVGGAAFLYYLYKNGALAGVNPANLATPAETLASTNATIANQLNAFNTAAGT